MRRGKERTGRGFFSGLGRFLDILRKTILNLIFWAIVILVVMMFIPPRIRIRENSFLYISPDGVLVDSVSRLSYPEGLAPYLDTVSETSVIELGQVIRTAAEDERITGAVLDLTYTLYGSPAVLQDLAEDLAYFRAAGKKLFAWAPDYNQSSYYLASLADQIYMDEMGRILLPGYGVYRSYYRQGMDRWDLDMAVFQAGEFKSFVEPYRDDRMSEGVKRDNARWLENLWDQYLTALEANRELAAGTVRAWLAEYPDDLKREGNSEALSALDAGLADTIGTYRDFSSDMIRYTGYDAESEGYRALHWQDYLTLLNRRPRPDKGKSVAVVTARGEIHSGEGTQWTIGSDSLVARLEQAGREPSVRAVVLRLDTGGGSAYASEEIRRALEQLRSDGIAVVVSMGGVTASGGYWIASEADQIWTAPGTVTGSIGVFAMIPQTDRFLEEHLGITGDGVGTTWMSGQGRPDQPLNSASRSVLQSGVDETYDRFLTLVSENRAIPRDELLPLAEGRVWTGSEAVRIGLADHEGTLREAVQAAADLVHLEEYNTLYFIPDGSTLLEMLASFRGGLPANLSEGLLNLLYPEIHSREAFTLEPGRIYALSQVANRNVSP